MPVARAYCWYRAKTPAAYRLLWYKQNSAATKIPVNSPISRPTDRFCRAIPASALPTISNVGRLAAQIAKRKIGVKNHDY